MSNFFKDIKKSWDTEQKKRKTKKARQDSVWASRWRTLDAIRTTVVPRMETTNQVLRHAADMKRTSLKPVRRNTKARRPNMATTKRDKTKVGHR